MSEIDNYRTASEELRDEFEKHSKQQAEDAEMFWTNLSYEDKCKAFHAVVNRIRTGELEHKGSYRHVLYQVFDFDMDMYTRGMDCGYMLLHNVIGDGQDYQAMKRVTRLEVIDDVGRALVKYLKDDEKLRYELQDDNRTLKVFVDKVHKTKLGEL